MDGLNIKNKGSLFEKHKGFTIRILAYRALYSLLPSDVIRSLKVGLENALIGEGAKIPPTVNLTGGWVVLPEVTIPGDWNVGDPVPPGVIPPPVISSDVESSGFSGPLFVEIFSGGPGMTEGRISSVYWIGT